MADLDGARSLSPLSEVESAHVEERSENIQSGSASCNIGTMSLVCALSKASQIKAPRSCTSKNKKSGRKNTATACAACKA